MRGPGAGPAGVGASPGLARKAARAASRKASAATGRAGRFFWAQAAGRADRLAFLGRTFLLGLESSLSGPLGRRRLVWSMLLEQAVLCFRNSALLASVMGLTAGFLWTVVWYGVLSNLGGTETLVSLALRIELAEVSPFLVAMVVTAAYTGPSASRLARIRTSGGFEILRLMGIPPAHLLAWPRFLGQLAAFPVLILFHCAFTIMGVCLGTRFFAAFPVSDFLALLVSGVKAYSLFRLTVQSILMSFVMSYCALHYPYRAVEGPGVEVPDRVWRGALKGLIWASLCGLLVSVLYA